MELERPDRRVAGLIGGIQEAWRGTGDGDAQDLAANVATLTVYMLRGMAVQDMLASDPVGGAMLRRLWSDLMQPFMTAGVGGKVPAMAVEG